MVVLVEKGHEVLLLKRTQTLAGEWCQISGRIEGKEKAWETGGLRFRGCFHDVLLSKASNDQVARSLVVDEALAAAMSLLLAASAAVYGAHTVNSLRLEAFQARQFGHSRSGPRKFMAENFDLVRAQADLHQQEFL